MQTCSIDGCPRERKYVTTGWCQTHYHRWYRTGSTDEPQRLTDWWEPVTYRATHARVVSTFGRAATHPCIDCGAQAKEWAYDGTDPSQILGAVNVSGTAYRVTWSRFPEFYMPLCFPCHRRLDRGRWAAELTCFACGHPTSAENVYTSPGGGRECRTCRRDRARDRARSARIALNARGLSSRGKPLRGTP